jgi:hypothetical protein
LNVYEPTQADIRAWAFSNERKWPASDWDFYVLRNPDHDPLAVELANDMACPKRDFFVHALYYLVGETFHNRAEVAAERVERIHRLLELVGDAAAPDLQQWKIDVQKLLAGELKLDPKFWLHFMFREDNG